MLAVVWRLKKLTWTGGISLSMDQAPRTDAGVK